MFPKDSPFVADLRGEEMEIKGFLKSHFKPFYNQWITYPVDFYYVGYLPIEKVMSILSNYPYIKTATHEVTTTLNTLSHEPMIQKVVNGTQSQSHLVQVYTTQIPRLSKDFFAIRLLNDILGVVWKVFYIKKSEKNISFAIPLAVATHLMKEQLQFALDSIKKLLIKPKGLLMKPFN
jgi:hypothetical protein